MSYLQSFDDLVTVSLFAILAGLSLTATGVLWAAIKGDGQTGITNEPSEPGYIALSSLATAAIALFIGLGLTLIFDSFLEAYNDILLVEVLDLLLTGVPLIIAILLLYSGASHLFARIAGHHKPRLLPSYLGWLSKSVDWVLIRVRLRLGP